MPPRAIFVTHHVSTPLVNLPLSRSGYPPLAIFLMWSPKLQRGIGTVTSGDRFVGDNGRDLPIPGPVYL